MQKTEIEARILKGKEPRGPVARTFVEHMVAVIQGSRGPGSDAVVESINAIEDDARQAEALRTVTAEEVNASMSPNSWPHMLAKERQRWNDTTQRYLDGVRLAVKVRVERDAPVSGKAMEDVARAASILLSRLDEPVTTRDVKAIETAREDLRDAFTKAGWL